MAALPTFHIVVHPRAEDALDRIIAGIAYESPLNGARFALRLAQKIKSLQRLPAACPYARENGHASIEVRQLLVGSYHMIFNIQSTTVHVLRVIHAKRDTLPPDELPDPR